MNRSKYLAGFMIAFVIAISFISIVSFGQEKVQEEGYVGPEICKECHPDLYEGFKKDNPHWKNILDPKAPPRTRRVVNLATVQVKNMLRQKERDTFSPLRIRMLRIFQKAVSNAIKSRRNSFNSAEVCISSVRLDVVTAIRFMEHRWLITSSKERRRLSVYLAIRGLTSQILSFRSTIKSWKGP